MSTALHSCLRLNGWNMPTPDPGAHAAAAKGTAMFANQGGQAGKGREADQRHTPSPWTGEDDYPDDSSTRVPHEDGHEPQADGVLRYPEDLALARACISGDEKAWRRFMETYRERLRSITWHYKCGGQFDDLFSEFVLKLLGGLDNPRGALQSYDGSVHLSTFLAVVFRHVVIDYVRYHVRRSNTHCEMFAQCEARYADPRAQSASDQSEREDMADVVCRAIKTLPVSQRRVVELYYFHELSMAETAAILNCSKSTICRELRAVYSTLRRSLATVEITGEPV